ncbi:MAG TPA: 30S ribosomal protein S8 [bacterium]|nr:30S ribosomal protein S8 [bacterium]
MACSDFVSDFLTVVRNASRAGKDKITVAASNVTIHISEILKEEGFIESAKVFTEGKKRFLRIHLRYLQGRKPVIQGLKRISKPGLRVYAASGKIPRIQGGLGVAIVSTSKGLLTDKKARQSHIGGEIVCTVW